jgi:hypothetical protein
VREVKVQGQVFAEIFYEIGDNPLINTPSLAGNSLVVPARDVLHVKLDTRRNPLIGETWLSALYPELATRTAIHSSAAAFSNNMSRPSGVIRDCRSKRKFGELRNRWNGRPRGAAAVCAYLTWHEVRPDLDLEPGRADIDLSSSMTKRSAVFGVPSCSVSPIRARRNRRALMANGASGLGFINHIEFAFVLSSSAWPQCRVGGNGPSSIRARCCARRSGPDWGSGTRCQAGIFDHD